MSALTLGPFRIEGGLGRGAMGQVWAARHLPTGVPAAVKVAAGELSPALQRDAEVEVRAVAALSHPGVVRLYDRGVVPPEAAPALGVAAGAPWLAMERSRGALTGDGCGPTEARHRLLQVLAALAHAHARGVVHLDIKPSNLLVAADGAVLLADFGVARLLGAPSGPTRGSLNTMAPEQLGSGSEVGPWTDLYAVGCTAFAWLTGAWPWPRTSAEIARRTRSASPVHLPGGGPAAEWIAWLTAPAPADRPPCAAAAATALAALDLPEFTSRGSAGDVATVWTGATGGDVSEPLPAPGQTRSTAGVRVRRGSPAVDAAGAALVPFRRWPLVGREDVLESLRAALAEVVRDRVPAAIGLSGPVGFGRTAILRAFLEQVYEDGSAGALGAFGPDLDHVRVDAGLPADPLACARRRPLVLGLDDAADRADWCRRLPGLLARDDLPMLVVVTARPDAKSVPGVVRWLDLPPLPDPVMAELVGTLVELDPAVAGAMVARAAGCPAYAVRTLESWVLTGVLVPGDAGWVLRTADPPLPADLGDALRAPLAAFAGQPLAALALLDPPVTPDLWARVAPGATDDLARRLVATGAVVRTAEGLAFVSGATRHAIADALPADVRADLHRRAADALPEGASAAARGRHALGAGRLDDARRWLEPAVFSSLSIGDLRTASLLASALESALVDLPADDPGRAGYLVAVAQLAHLQGRARDAAQAAAAAARIAGDVATAARARQIGAAALQRAGDLRGALALFAEAEQAFASAGLGSRRVECLASAEEVFTMLGEEDAADEALERALALLHEADDAVAGITLARRGWRLIARGRPDEALVALDDAERRFAVVNKPLLSAIAASYRGAAHRARGDLASARAELLGACARMEAAGSADADVVRLGLLQLELDADRPSEVLGEAERLARRFARLGRRPHEACAATLALWARARLGDHDEGFEADLRALTERMRGTGLAHADLRRVVDRLVDALAGRPDLATLARDIA